MNRMHLQVMGGDPHGDPHGNLHGNRDMDNIRVHIMQLLEAGEDHGDPHGDRDMDNIRVHITQLLEAGEDHDDDPERFFRASESFIEQLQHAKAVAGQLDNDAAVALLAIWYASEHMEPEQCLDLMVSVMNDDSIVPKVRRAAAFTGVQKAGELGNDQLAQRILGAIIRGAGMTESARMRRNDDARQTDRRPGRVTDRAPHPEHDDAPIQQRRDRR